MSPSGPSTFQDGDGYLQDLALTIRQTDLGQGEANRDPHPGLGNGRPGGLGGRASLSLDEENALCIAAKGRKGRRVMIHPQEALLQQARALQQSTHYDEYRARRVVVEHRLARLVQLGIRQSRYFGRVKTRFQLYLAATVANLTLVAGKLGRSGRTGGGATGRSVVLNIVPFVVAHAAANFCAVRLGQLWSVILLTSALLPKSPYQTGTFRPGF